MQGVKQVSKRTIIGVTIAVCLPVTLALVYPGLHQAGVDTELREAVMHQDEVRVHAALEDGANARGDAWVVNARGPLETFLNFENLFRGSWRRWPPSNRAKSRRNQHNLTLLMFAGDNENAAVMDDLLAHGAEIEARLANGNTALFRCIGRGAEPCLEALLRHGADVNARNTAGQTPLHLAARNDSASVLRRLLEHGGDVTVRDNSGSTPLSVAARVHSVDACLLLLGKGASPADLRFRLTPGTSRTLSIRRARANQYPLENESPLAWASSSGSLLSRDAAQSRPAIFNGSRIP